MAEYSLVKTTFHLLTLIHEEMESYSESPFLIPYFALIAYVFFLKLQHFGFHIEVLQFIFILDAIDQLLLLGFLLPLQNTMTKNQVRE